MIVQVANERVEVVNPENVGGVDNMNYLIDQVGFENDVYADYGLLTLVYVGY